MQRGKFVVFDGLDGSGKGTQIEMLKPRLAGKAHFTREPGGTPRAEQIRALLLEKDRPRSVPACDFFLFWAARASHVQDVVGPKLKAGIHVVCDRYDSSTWAFQICGEERRDLRPLFRGIRATLPTMLLPDAYFILDLPSSVAYERMTRDAEDKRSHFDLKPREYHERVREGFQEFGKLAAEHRGAKYFIVDANREKEAVHQDIWEKLRGVLCYRACS